MKRQLIYVNKSEAVTDGDGVKINRNVARKALQTFDPFLLLDEIFSDDPEDYIGGFPEHPHRGFETVTYMLQGSMKHRDHMGNEGFLQPGSVQWMTAGRGVLHSEMPMQDQGRMHGFQLWVNLPASEKMQDPDYQEYSGSEVPVIERSDNNYIKVIAGEYDDGDVVIQGPVNGVTTKPDYFDIALSAFESITLNTQKEKTVLLYPFEGSISVEDRVLAVKHLGMLSEGDSVTITAREDCRLLFLAGNPIREPIANWGPFVMNTPEQIEEAINDYKMGRLV